MLVEERRQYIAWPIEAQGHATVNELGDRFGTSAPTVRNISTPSRETIAVMDSSKFEQRSLSLIATLDDIDAVITDTNTPRAVADALRQRGVTVTMV